MLLLSLLLLLFSFRPLCCVVTRTTDSSANFVVHDREAQKLSKVQEAN